MDFFKGTLKISKPVEIKFKLCSIQQSIKNKENDEAR